METLAIVFVILVFLALLSPEIKPDPPSAGDQLVKGLKAVVKEIHGGGGGDSKSDDSFWTSPWSIMLFAIFLGLFLTI